MSRLILPKHRVGVNVERRFGERGAFSPSPALWKGPP